MAFVQPLADQLAHIQNERLDILESFKQQHEALLKVLDSLP